MSGVREAFLKFCKDFGINPGGQFAEEDGYLFEEGYKAGKRSRDTESRLLLINEAAVNLVRDALDSMDNIHPCDQHNDEVKAKALPPLMKALYEAIRNEQ